MHTINWTTLCVLVIASTCFAEEQTKKNDSAKNQNWQAAGTIDGFTSHITSLAFGPGSILALGDGGQAHVWDVATKQELPFYKRHPKFERGIVGITYAADNTWVSFRELNASHLAFGSTYLVQGVPIDYGVGGGGSRSLAIASDGITYAAHSALGKKFGRENVVDVVQDDIITRVTQKLRRNPGIIAECRGHQGEPTCAAFSPDRKLLATGSTDKTVRLWEPPTGKELAVLSGHTDAVAVVEFCPNGALLASGGKDGGIRLWEIAENTLKATLPADTPVRCLTFSPENRLLAAGYEDGKLRIWSVDDVQPVKVLTDHTGTIFAVAFSRDGNILASGGQDKTLRLWEK